MWEEATVTGDAETDWVECKLGELADITSSKRIFYSDYVPVGVPFYRSKEIIDRYSRRTSKAELFISEERFSEIKNKFGVPVVDDILLTSVGTLGIPYLVNSKDRFYFKDGNLTWFRSINKNIIDVRFLLIWLTSPIGKQRLDEITIGSTQPALTIAGLKKVEIDLPTLPEQSAIADVVSCLDRKIDLLHRQNATLEALAETLFQQWFIVDIQNLKLGKFGDWVEVTIGGDWGKEVPEGEFTQPVYCIRGTDVADLQTGLAYKTPLRFVKPKKFENIEPKTGDIIIEISGGTENQSTGRALYVNDDIKSFYGQPLVFSNFCRMIRPLKEDYCFFLYLYIQYLYKQDEFFGLENGSSGIKNLDYKALLFEIEYMMPTEDRVLEFDKLVSTYFSKINQNKRQVQTLERLRDTLLPRLMSGEVRVAY